MAVNRFVRNWMCIFFCSDYKQLTDLSWIQWRKRSSVSSPCEVSHNIAYLMESPNYANWGSYNKKKNIVNFAFYSTLIWIQFLFTCLTALSIVCLSSAEFSDQLDVFKLLSDASTHYCSKFVFSKLTSCVLHTHISFHYNYKSFNAQSTQLRWSYCVSTNV